MEEKITAWCVKCRAKREMINPETVEFKGKGGKARKALTSRCPVCGTKMFRILPKEKKEDIDKEINEFDRESQVE